jgi:hypothetical protein
LFNNHLLNALFVAGTGIIIIHSTKSDLCGIHRDVKEDRQETSIYPTSAGDPSVTKQDKENKKMKRYVITYAVVREGISEGWPLSSIEAGRGLGGRPWA